MQNRSSIFQILSSLFKKHRVRIVLVGGYALIANKVQRMTFDIDFLMTETDYSKIEQDVIKMGYSVLNRQDAFVQLKSDKKGLRDLDFLISDSDTVESLISHGKEISIAGERFVVPSPMHLIEMKLHSIANNKNRELKDIPDIVQLMRMNAIDPKEKRISNLFKKYHLMDLYESIIHSTKDGKWNE